MGWEPNNGRLHMHLSGLEGNTVREVQMGSPGSEQIHQFEGRRQAGTSGLSGLLPGDGQLTPK